MKQLFTRRAADHVAAGVTVWARGLGLALIGLALLYALGSGKGIGDGLRTIGASFALSAMAILVGAFFGLLFGLPREIELPADARPRSRFLTNNNLLRVSDWVTTILVGLTLVNLREVPSLASDFGEWVKPALGTRDASAGFGLFLLIAGFTGAFILMYIWTLVTLRQHLEDQSSDIARVQQLAGDVAAGRKGEKDLADELKTDSPQVLDQLQTNVETTPPLLRRLAEEEKQRRGEIR